MPFHKVQLSAEKAAALEKQGAKVLGDYGSFKLLQVDDATLDSLPVIPGVELRDDYDHILLNAGVIDTTTQHAKTLRGMRKTSSGKRFYIVQFAGPVRSEWYEQLEATGVQVVTYIPNNAYVVYGAPAEMDSLQRHITAAPAIQWDGEYLDDYKLDPSVNTVDTSTYLIQLIKDAENNDTTLALIRQLQSREGTVQEALGYVNVEAWVDRKALDEIVRRPDVLSIHARPQPRKFDERQNMIMAGQITGNGPTGPGYLTWLLSKGFSQEQFSASGFGVDVSDSGLDNGTQAPNHFAMYVNGDVTGTSRVVYNRLEGTANSGSTIQGCDGHGNVNAHIIAGYVTRNGAPFTDVTGFSHGLGVAPFVKVGSSVVFDPGTFTSPNYENLQARAYRDGMRISSNSWGARANTYTADSQRYDALVRDAQPTGSVVPVAGNQEMIIVFAAGNSGSAVNTVGSPATAKNVLTVGASENVRPFGGADNCSTADSGADSLHDVATFSSRGPTSDGRKKPDLMAPGTHVGGGVAQAAGQRSPSPGNPTGQALSCFDGSGVCGGPSGSNFFPLGQQWFSASTGTSHSTPAVAGGTALVRQYFINQGINAPSSAMTKAYLMNSARYMTGAGANDTLFSNNQGMGLMDLGMAFDGIPRLLDDQNPANLFTATGQTRTFSGVVADSSSPFRVTLAWTDAPGSTTGSAWKNNLDLTVTVGGKAYKGNVFSGASSTTGGSADSSNNVESVFLPAGTATGPYTVTVTATNINSDGVPNTGTSLDQDFALIAYNSCSSATAAPSGATASVSADNSIDVSWTTNDAAEYVIYRATSSGGPYSRVGTAKAPPFTDTGLSGGTTYYYVVRAKNCAESDASNETSAMATGVCALPPTFAGLNTATNGAASTCASTLSWSAATPICGGAISYSVYRGTTAGFTPSAANRIATGLTGTSFADDLNLSNATTYHYVVRATEASSATIEERNTVQRTVTPTGVITPGVRFFDDFDSNRPDNASAYWMPTVVSGSATTMALVSGCRFQSPTNAYRMGATTTTCGGTYSNSQQHILALGGNGSTSSSINGFSIPTNAFNPQMTFNVWYNMEARFDGVYLVYSTAGANGPWTAISDAVSSTQPYISTGGYDNTLSSNSALRIWTSTNTGTNGALKAVNVNLNALAGQKAWFGFRFHSDSTGVAEGFYVDDVRVVADSAASCATNVPPPGPAVAYRVDGLPTVVSVGRQSTFNVSALDAVGGVAVDYNGSASLTSTDAAAVLPATVSFTGGVASGLSATFNTPGAQSITATDTEDASLTGSGTTTVTAATRLVFTTQPASSVVAGASMAPRVGLLDKDGNAVTTGSFNVTLSIGNNAGGGTLSGTVSVNMVAGVATFSGLSIDKIGTGYTLRATSAGLTEATSSAFNVTPATASKLAFVTQPSTTVVGTAITPAVQVAIQDTFGNQTTSTSNVVLALATNTSGGTLSGTTTVAAVSGLATFSNLSIDKVGTEYKLNATSGSLTSTSSNVFTVMPGAPFRVTITRQPTNVVAGASMAPAVQVSLYDRFGNLATQATHPVTVSLGYNTTGATLGGVTTANAVAGVATFDSLSVSRPGLNYTLVAGTSGLYLDTSVSFNVSEGPAARLAFRAPPANAVAGTTLAPVTVEVQDGLGNLNPHSTEAVTLSLGGPSGGMLGGSTTVSAVNGVATFPGLSIQRAASGYTLRAEATGLSSATSGAFTIAPGAAAALVFSAQPGDVMAGAPFAQAVKVAVLDMYGNLVTNAQGEVALALSGTEGASLTGTQKAAAINGVATFPGLSINRVGMGYTLAASAGSLAGATSSAFDVRPGAPARLAFKTGPGYTRADSVLAPVQVEILDAHGNAATAANTVTLQLSGSGGTLGGTTTVSAVNGVATFADLSITHASAGYRLTARGEGLVETTSSMFTVAPGAAAALAFSVQPSTAQAGAMVGPAVQVTIKDAFGNVVTDASDAISLSLGTNFGNGTLSGNTTVAAVNGVATFSGLSIERAASGYTLLAEADGLSSASSGAFTITPGAAAALVFSAQPGNVMAGGSFAQAVKVAVLDAYGNLVTNAQDEVSLALSGAEGSAFTGTQKAAAVNGVATFPGLSVNRVGTGYTLAASAGSLAGATSSAFDVRPGAPARLAFKTGPAHTKADSVLAPVQVELLDAHGNAVMAANTITLTLTGGSGGTLGGTTTVSAVDGVATFAGLSITHASAGYRLMARGEGLVDTTSAVFAVSPGAAAALAFSVQPSTAQAGAMVGPAVRVTIQDAFGNVVTDASDAISLSLGTNLGNGTLGGTTTVSAVNGVATFTELSLNSAARGYTLQASSGALPSVTSAAFDITTGAPARLVFRGAPGQTPASATLGSIKVELQDALGNVLSDSTTLVTLSLGENPVGGMLLGSATVSAVKGVATFNGLSLRKTGTGYTLVASSQGFAGATSAAFDVTPGSASSFALTLHPSVTAGQEFTLSATAYDAHGNVATSYAGTTQVTSSDAAAVLPANARFIDGVLNGLKVTFKSPGLRTLSLVDASQANLKGVAQTNVTPFPQPTVAVTEPAGGSTVSGKVRISATGAVAPGTTLSQLSLLVDGVVIATGKEATLSAEWDGSKAESGSSHTVTAVISDGAGNVVSSAPVGFTVPNESCGCGATSGTDASLYLGLFALARYVAVRRRRTKLAA